MKTVAFLLMGLVLLSSALYADATFYGPTGLIAVPTAESLQYKEYNVAVDYAISSQLQDRSQWFYKMNLGTFKNCVLGSRRTMCPNAARRYPRPRLDEITMEVKNN